MSYFNSRRSTVVARRGAVATSQPLAAQAGLQMLMAGGNAMDAAVATAAALTVVEPMSTGLGGDMFCLYWDAKTKKMTALNGSGRAAAAADPEVMRQRGHSKMPLTGKDAACSVTVPGTVDGWETALKQHGRMSFKEVLQPAIMYAEDGFAVSPVVAHSWQEAEALLQSTPSGQELLLDGRAPRYGEIVRLPHLATILKALRSENDKGVFYQGEVAQKIAAHVQSNGGWLTTDDLAAHTSTWETPISTEYRGAKIWECPPNGQGMAALLALNIAENFDFTTTTAQSATRYHMLIEAMRLGFADAFQYVADPAFADVPVDALLNKNYAKQRYDLINPARAFKNVHYGDPLPSSNTVYITVVDAEGNACSFINSVFQGFGSGLVVPGTNIALHNRGAGFSLDPEHSCYLQPNKRPYHTIIPAMVTDNDEFWMSFGVMGAFQQPQGHLQVISNMLDFNMDPQQALDALRFSIDLEHDLIKVEKGTDIETIMGLEKRAHKVQVIDGFQRQEFGGGQIIVRDPVTGVLFAGSEPRKDGAAVGF